MVSSDGSTGCVRGHPRGAGQHSPPMQPLQAQSMPRANRQRRARSASLAKGLQNLQALRKDRRLAPKAGVQAGLQILPGGLHVPRADHL